ncbi:hypothetical protein [Vibrio penaeicida]|uniref:hypothetical protein n=1 Tax=Vibrio penaeicida TaxID=104609 RepID=UPI000CE9B8EF|nr:hypothetical protein [Vibrio penaeicida]
MTNQVFRYSTEWQKTIKICVVVLALMGGSFLYLTQQDIEGIDALGMMASLPFLLLAFVLGHLARNLPNKAIELSNDGVWYQHEGEVNGKVLFDRVCCIKERAFLQRLDLLDSEKRKLISIDYKLADFEILRYALCDRINSGLTAQDQSEFKKGRLAQFFHLAGVICFLFMPLIVLWTELELSWFLVLGLLFVTVLIIFEYFNTPTQLVIRKNAFSVRYRLRHTHVGFDEVIGLQMADALEKGSRTPYVLLTCRNLRKPIKLKGLGVDVNRLFSILENTITKKQ